MTSDTSDVGVAGIESKQNDTGSSRYNFSEDQKKMFRDLGSKMGFVSLCFLVIGVPFCIIKWMFNAYIWHYNQHHIEQQIDAMISSIQIFVLYLIYLWTSKTASAFNMIEKPGGNDLDKLMNALRKMRNLYRVQRSILEFTLVSITLIYGGIFVWHFVRN